LDEENRANSVRVLEVDSRSDQSESHLLVIGGDKARDRRPYTSLMLPVSLWEGRLVESASCSLGRSSYELEYPDISTLTEQCMQRLVGAGNNQIREYERM
jgi:hypothetical protein